VAVEGLSGCSFSVYPLQRWTDTFRTLIIFFLVFVISICGILLLASSRIYYVFWVNIKNFLTAAKLAKIVLSTKIGAKIIILFLKQILVKIKLFQIISLHLVLNI